MKYLLRCISHDCSHLKRDRYSYVKQLANQFQFSFQYLVLRTNKNFCPNFLNFTQGEEGFLRGDVAEKVSKIYKGHLGYKSISFGEQFNYAHRTEMPVASTSVNVIKEPDLYNDV